MKRAMTIRVLSAVLALTAFAMTSPSVTKPAPGHTVVGHREPTDCIGDLRWFLCSGPGSSNKAKAIAVKGSTGRFLGIRRSYNGKSPPPWRALLALDAPATVLPEKRPPALAESPASPATGPSRDFTPGPTPGALQGDNYPLEFYEDGFPKLPACLDRRAVKGAIKRRGR